MPISYSSSENALMSRREFATDESRVRDFAELGLRSIAVLFDRDELVPQLQPFFVFVDHGDGVEHQVRKRHPKACRVPARGKPPHGIEKLLAFRRQHEIAKSNPAFRWGPFAASPIACGLPITGSTGFQSIGLSRRFIDSALEA